MSLTLYLFQKPHTQWLGPEDFTVPAGSRTVAVDSLEKSVNCVILSVEKNRLVSLKSLLTGRWEGRTSGTL